MMWIIILVAVAVFVFGYGEVTWNRFFPSKEEAPAYSAMQAQWLGEIKCRGCMGAVKYNGLWDSQHDSEEVDMRTYKTRFGSQVYGLTDTPRYYFCAGCVKAKKAAGWKGQGNFWRE